MDKKEWEILDITEFCDAKIFSIQKLKSKRLFDGRISIFYRMLTKDWVNIVPITKQGDLVLIKQFRQGIQDWTIEIPGGVLEDNEPPINGGSRELREETGYLSNNLIYLGAIYPNPALQNNQCHMILATQCWKGSEVEFDPDENIEVMLVKPIEALNMVLHGKITNVMAISSILFALNELGFIKNE